jgi:hypothetical protein
MRKIMNAIGRFFWVSLGYRELPIMLMAPWAARRLLRSDLRNQLKTKTVSEVMQGLDKWAQTANVPQYLRPALRSELLRAVREITTQ